MRRRATIGYPLRHDRLRVSAHVTPAAGWPARHGPGHSGPRARSRRRRPVRRLPRPRPIGYDRQHVPRRMARAPGQAFARATPWSSWSWPAAGADGQRRSTPSVSSAARASASDRWPRVSPHGRATSKPTKTARTASSASSCCRSPRGQPLRSSRQSDVGRRRGSTAQGPRARRWADHGRVPMRSGSLRPSSGSAARLTGRSPTAQGAAARGGGAPHALVLVGGEHGGPPIRRFSSRVPLCHESCSRSPR